MNKQNFLRVCIILIMLVLSLGLPQAVTALSPAGTSDTIYYVKAAPTGLEDCSSWANACSLQYALGPAISGYQIWVAAGIYYPGELSSSTFQLKDGVKIYGGFPAAGGTWEERDWINNVTVLSGDIGGDDITDPNGVVTDTVNIVGQNAYHVVRGNDVTTTAILDGFIITAGYANLSAPNRYGGGMYTAYGSPTLNDIIFSGNTAGKGTAYYAGGGMFNYYGNPVLTNVNFIANSAGSGGGMYNHGSAPTLENVTFSGNKAIDASCMTNYQSSSPILNGVVFDGNVSSNKGCMVNDTNSNPVLTDIAFLSNSSNYGSGMYNYQSSPTLTEVVFSDNISGHVGGAIENEDNSNPTLTDVLFVGNSAAHEGGGIFNGPNCTPVLTNVAFINNSVTGQGGGGGIKTYNSSPILTNVTFSGNHAVVGGGIDNWQSNLTLKNVTFSGNTADWYGSAMYSQESTPSIINTIIWGNIPSDSQMLNDRGVSTITYSIIPGGFSGEGNLNGDPRLGPLAYNGGFTPTFALPLGSLAIDTGSPSICPATDQRGMPRPVDGNGDGVPRCDMGAFEAQLVPLRGFLPIVMR